MRLPASVRRACAPSLLCGVGTGGSAADVAAALCVPHLRVPFWVGHGAEVPAFVGPDTLVFALSASGRSPARRWPRPRRRPGAGPPSSPSGGTPRACWARGPRRPVCVWCPRGETGARTVTALAATVLPVLVALGAAGLVPEAAPLIDAVAATLAPAARRLRRPRRAGRAGGPEDRAHHPAGLRGRGGRRRGRPLVEGAGEPQRQGAGVRRHGAGGHVRRAGRVGPGWRHHPPGGVAGAAPTRTTSPRR